MATFDELCADNPQLETQYHQYVNNLMSQQTAGMRVDTSANWDAFCASLKAMSQDCPEEPSDLEEVHADMIAGSTSTPQAPSPADAQPTAEPTQTTTAEEAEEARGASARPPQPDVSAP